MVPDGSVLGTLWVCGIVFGVVDGKRLILVVLWALELSSNVL